jgi:hypothetical protein
MAVLRPPSPEYATQNGSLRAVQPCGAIQKTHQDHSGQDYGTLDVVNGGWNRLSTQNYDRHP